MFADLFINSSPQAPCHFHVMFEHSNGGGKDYGATFVLDPDALDSSTGSWGPLALNPNVEALLLGSGLTPQDEVAPDKVTRIRCHLLSHFLLFSVHASTLLQQGLNRICVILWIVTVSFSKWVPIKIPDSEKNMIINVHHPYFFKEDFDKRTVKPVYMITMFVARVFNGTPKDAAYTSPNGVIIASTLSIMLQARPYLKKLCKCLIQVTPCHTEFPVTE